MIGSHLDTVPHAGAFDGILGVVLAIALVEAPARVAFASKWSAFPRRKACASACPSSAAAPWRATLRCCAHGCVAEAIREFGLDPGGTRQTR